MKTFAKLFAVLAFLAVGFTACSDDDDYTLTIDVEVSTSGVVTGKVDASEGISTATLYLVTEEGRESISSFSAKNINNDGTFRIENLADGKYELEVKDKDSNVKSKIFTIGTEQTTPEIDWTKGVNTISANGTYAYKQGDKEGVLVVSELTATSVKVALDGKAAVELTDADASYLLKDGTASKQAGVTADNFLLAKKAGESSIVDKDGLKTAIEGAAGVVFVKQ